MILLTSRCGLYFPLSTRLGSTCSFGIQIDVPPDVIAAARQLWSPPEHPVFKLVPDSFDVYATQFYADLGHPVVSSFTLWDIFGDMLQCFHNIPDDAVLDAILHDQLQLQTLVDGENVPIAADQQEWVAEPLFAVDPTAGEGNDNDNDDFSNIFSDEEDIDEPY